ncbi:hypothetical Protein psc1_00470 [Candidatus Phytoplasma solani]
MFFCKENVFKSKELIKIFLSYAKNIFLIQFLFPDDLVLHIRTYLSSNLKHFPKQNHILM